MSQNKNRAPYLVGLMFLAGAEMDIFALEQTKNEENVKRTLFGTNFLKSNKKKSTI